MIDNLLESVYDKVGDFLTEHAISAPIKALEEVAGFLNERYGKSYEALRDYFYLAYRYDPDYKDLSDDKVKQMAEAEAKKWIEHHKILNVVISTIFNMVLTGGGVIGFLMGIVGSEIQRGRQLANYLAPIELPDIGSLIAAFFKGKIDKEYLTGLAKRLGFSDEMTEILIQSMERYLDFTQVRDGYYKGLLTKDEAVEYLKKLGFNNDVLDKVLEIDRPLLSPTDIKDLYLRGDIDDATHDELMKKFGYEQEQIDLMKKLYFYIPTPADLIRMAVKEAFSPEVAERFGQYEDFPEEFAEWARKIGISEEWAKRYWAAHWDLPSLSAGYEMLHRGIIDEDTLKLLMRSQDIMPFWRDKLIQLSYEVYTRVDVRRMYEEGVLTEEEVKRAYMDLGYDEEKAERLTEWTVKQATSEDRKLSRSIIEGLYKRNLLSEDEAVNALVDIGYREEYARLLIAKAEYDKQKKVKDRIVTAVRKLYLNGQIDENEAIEKLSEVNLLASEIDMLIEEWRLEKQARIKHLSMYELKQIAKKGIIDKETFIEEAKKIGYPEKYAEWIYQSL